MTPILLKFEDAAKLLGIPKTDLCAAADEHGFTVSIRKTRRIEADKLKELIEQCRVNPKAPSSTFAKPRGRERPSTSSETARMSSQRAQTIADQLKRHSGSTSQKKSDQ
ncbi:hypothetical protein [Maritimibacter sp. DP1N21-5]|uniref:hypothetical protein n=1 Tax=Maritimibacter sp. DP1N21-5 TaxID=2836867 RepID=UPI001C45CBFB|nr:hypothetical protein [Maritimibacter sp. DP1N21-5]MBV7408840.1 hypothetical protein [Maritimibacter sp. DP1N21-5]